MMGGRPHGRPRGGPLCRSVLRERSVGNLLRRARGLGRLGWFGWSAPGVCQIRRGASRRRGSG